MYTICSRVGGDVDGDVFQHDNFLSQDIDGVYICAMLVVHLIFC